MTKRALWGRRSAFNVQKVLWALDEVGIECDQLDAGGSFGGLDTPEFLEMNPHGRVPVLVDGDLIVWESHSILRYLGARYGSTRFWPDAPGERSLADRWLDWSLATLQPSFMSLFWSYFRTPERDRNSTAVAKHLRACDEHFRLLDRQLESRPFLAGAHFSLADIPAGACLYRYFEMGVEVPRHRNIEDWYSRLRERPAYRSQVMLPFDELRGRLEF